MAARPRKAFLLRLDVQVHEELRRLAASELRSVNGQIEYLIREALQRRGRNPGAGGLKKGTDDGPEEKRQSRRTLGPSEGEP